MDFLWEKTIEEQIEKRRAVYADDDFLPDITQLPKITSELRGYFMDLQGEMQELLSDDDPIWNVERIKRSLLTDAKLSFLINELTTDPYVTYDELKRREARFYRSDYLTALDVEVRGTLLEYIFCDEPKARRKEENR